MNSVCTDTSLKVRHLCESAACRGRPAGDLRVAVTSCITELGPVTLRDLCGHVQSTPRALSSALRNMLRDGALVKCGMERRPHAKRWVALYDVPESTHSTPTTPTPQAGAPALQAALCAWGSFA